MSPSRCLSCGKLRVNHSGALMVFPLRVQSVFPSQYARQPLNFSEINHPVVSQPSQSNPKVISFSVTILSFLVLFLTYVGCGARWRCKLFFNCHAQRIDKLNMFV